MARKTTTPMLADWDAVNVALSKMGHLDRLLSRIANTANAAIDRIKAKASEEAQPHAAERELLEAQLKTFCKANKRDFDTSRHRVLSFGKVGFRRSTRVQLPKDVDMVALLKEHKLTDCIIVKETVNKEALERLPLATLEVLGITVKPADNFEYEVDVAKITDAAA